MTEKNGVITWVITISTSTHTNPDTSFRVAYPTKPTFAQIKRFWESSRNGVTLHKSESDGYYYLRNIAKDVVPQLVD